ncbi:DEAD/DEAH box helicase, partial [Escherichia coli]|uniref:DEAD/DEAH box helicase n=1 Tax=Escherichia coli TaxID=562 RepID=UPI00200E7B71
GKKVVFLAPTKPLAEQHLNSFKKYLPELFADMQLFTGNVSPENRKKIWQTADIIFSTPQCVANDLRKNLYNLNEVCLLIEDEAHRCVRNYDY